jgi:energy-coupling factor transporter ATP-binding protein EcfA2
MNEQVMIYEVKSSASSNAQELFSNDSKYFYWNETKLKNLNIGDFVFVVNRTNKWVAFCKLDKIDIRTTEKGDTTIFSDLKKDFVVSGKWNNFMRLELINMLTIPNDWVWQSLGSSETSYLNGSRIGLNSSENRIKNINQLQKLSDEQLFNQVLNDCLLNFTEGAMTKEPSIWFVTQGSTFQEDRGKKFLWAPEKGKDNKGRFYWANVLKVKKGDIIFNYSEGELKGVSLATNDGYKSSNDDAKSSWGKDGFRVDIDLILLDPSLKSEIFSRNISSFNTYLTKVNNKPFGTTGSINQGYLYEFSKEAGRFIRDIYKKPFGNKRIDDFFDKVKLISQNSNKMEESKNNILTAIKTKPFILLAGISGTGKSRLVRTLAYKTCSKDELRTNPKKPGNFELIPVRPNWHDSSELMGYVSRINGEKYITTSFLQFIAKAWKNIDVPFLLCLDEMNLAPVEQYFAEYLSIIETRQVQSEKIGTDYLISKASFENHALYSQLLSDLGLEEIEFPDGISIPVNLVVIGTVNMDETTHSFSRKVLDRAMTFEMNDVDLNAGLDNTKNDWSYPQTFISSNEVLGDFTSGAEVMNKFAESRKVIDFLLNLNLELEGTPFKIAYRVRDEFLIYCYYASLNQTNSNWLTNALDEMTSMKILSRIEGDETKTGSVLSNLQRVLTADYKKSNAKLKEMETRLSTSGYTSFWS